MNLHDWIRAEEGFRSKPYLCSAGKLTIGYGRNIEDRGISSTEADTLLLNDVTIAELGLVTVLGAAFVELLREERPATHAALVNMVYQLGLPRFSGFKKMISALLQQNWSKAANEALDSRWAEQTPARAKRVAWAIRYNEMPEEF